MGDCLKKKLFLYFILKEKTDLGKLFHFKIRLISQPENFEKNGQRAYLLLRSRKANSERGKEKKRETYAQKEVKLALERETPPYFAKLIL